MYKNFNFVVVYLVILKFSLSLSKYLKYILYYILIYNTKFLYENIINILTLQKLKKKKEKYHIFI